MVIAFQEGKARQEMAQQQQQSIETQNRGLQELEAQKAQAEQQTSMMKAQAEVVVVREKGMMDILTKYLETSPQEASIFAQEAMNRLDQGWEVEQ